MMLQSRGLAGVGAVVVAAVAFALPVADVAQAAAKPKKVTIKTAQYTIAVEGTQTTTWTLDQTTYDYCVQGEIHKKGSGSETMTFASTRRATLTVTQVGKSAFLTAAAKGIPVKGTYTRKGQIVSQQLNGGESGCGGVETPEAPVPPDCGTRLWSGVLHPTHVEPSEYPGEPPIPLTPVLLLEGPELPEGGGFGTMFRNCPSIGEGTRLIPTGTSSLSAKRLMSAKTTRLVVKGNDRSVTTSDGFHRQTRVSWTATLTRLKARARR